MPRRKLVALAVCGSGVVSSSMLAQKIKDTLNELKIDVEVIGLLPNSVQGYIERQNIDFVVTTSPIPGTITVPVIKGIGLLTGFGEEEALEEIRQVAKVLINKDLN